MRNIILSMVSCLILTACWDTGTGNKIGIVTRLNKSGVFCKTWEGQVIRGGMNNGSGNFGAAFDFTIESDELAEQVQEALDSQKEVKIFYRGEANSFCRSDSNSIFLTKIEIYKPSESVGKETPKKHLQ